MIWTRWNKCDKIQSSADVLFKWCYRSRRCRCCLLLSIFWVGAEMCSKITSCCLQSLIGQLSFLLVPTMVQLYSVHAKRNEHWTKQTLWELHISTPHEFLTAANSWCGPTNESIVQKWINEIQSTPDNSNLEGKSKKKFELLGVRSK